MAELVERLKHLSERAKRATTLAAQRTMAGESGWLKIEELDAIIAALEDRERLRAALMEAYRLLVLDWNAEDVRAGTQQFLHRMKYGDWKGLIDREDALEGRDG